MRLICPTCDTAYDVPPGQIPDGGRHVQCSTCHTRWFARPPQEPAPSEDQIIYRLETRAARPRPVLAEVPAPTAVTEPAAPAPRAMPEAAPRAAPEPAPAPESAPAPVDDFVWETAPAAAASDPLRRPAATEPRPQPQPQPLHPPAPPPPPRPVAVTPPPLAVVAPPPAPAASPPAFPEAMRTELAPPPPPRPAGFPDARADTDAVPAAAAADAHPLRTETARPQPEGWNWDDRLPARSRFGRGVLVALALFAAALVLYAAAGELAARVPALSRALGVYVDLVDGLRAALDFTR